MPCYSAPMTEEEATAYFRAAFGVDMPCNSNDARTSEDLRESSAFESDLDRVTRLLCFVCKGIESGKLDEQAPELQELHEWWEKHKKWDAEREAKEQESNNKNQDETQI